MELLHNGFTLNIPKCGFPLSTDSMVLADFIQLKKDATVLDLGSGCGTLGMLLCAKFSNCRVTGVELNEAAHQAAVQNITSNGLESRMESICGDLRSISPGNFHTCVSNPPYFTGGPVSTTAGSARHNLHCTTDELFTAASKALRFGGDFYIVHKPDQLAAICAAASQQGLEPKHLRLVYHKPNTQPALILLQCRKGAKPGLKWDSVTLHEADGAPNDDYRRIYHI